MDWVSLGLLVAGVLGAVLKLIIPQWVSKAVDNKFNEKLETHKHELNKLTEEAKFNYQRLLSDFNLYSVKKHEHYIELYNVLIRAHGRVMCLASPLKQLSTYDFFDESDMREYLIEKGTPSGKTEELIIKWKKDRKAGTKEIQEHEAFIEEWNAERDVNILNNTYLGSQLYLSDDLNKLFEQLVSDLRSFFINCKREYKPIGGQISAEEYIRISAENSVLEKKIDINKGKIIVKMQSELSVGYYKA